MTEETINEKASRELSETMNSIYFPIPNQETKVFRNKQELLKELQEIEDFETRHDPEIEKKNMAELRKKVERHQLEQQQRNIAVDRSFSQMSHTDKDGKVIYGS